MKNIITSFHITCIALSDGRYKSCFNRAVVNKKTLNVSLDLFLNPDKDKMVRPPTKLVEYLQLYVDFTWPDVLQFNQKLHKVDSNTLQPLSMWLQDNNVEV